MNYNSHLIARTEHEARNHALRTCHENDFWTTNQIVEDHRVLLLQLRVALTALINLIIR